MAAMWRPIKTAPECTPVLVVAKGWLPVIAVRFEGKWGECLGGEYYGTKVGFTPTHWQPLEPLKP